VGPAVVGEWAKKDPQAALTWLETHLTGGKSDAYAAWISGCAEKGFGDASLMVNGLPDSQGRDRAITALASKWMDKDVPGAVAWLATQPTGPAKSAAYQQIGYTWAEKDPAGYLDFYATAKTADLPLQNAYPVTQALASKKEPEAFAWIEQLPDDRKDEVLSTYVRNSGYNKTAEQLIQTLSYIKDPTLRANLVPNMAQSALTSGDDESRAVAFVNTLSSEEKVAVIIRLESTSYGDKETDERRISLLKTMGSVKVRQ
jgi:hypothetical protein